jgi:hypothetical protein
MYSPQSLGDHSVVADLFGSLTAAPDAVSLDSPLLHVAAPELPVFPLPVLAAIDAQLTRVREYAPDMVSHLSRPSLYLL